MDNICREALIQQVKQHQDLGERLIFRFEEKQAHNKALADALWAARNYGSGEEDACWGMAPCLEKRAPQCLANVALLKAVGRL